MASGVQTPWNNFDAAMITLRASISLAAIACALYLPASSNGLVLLYPLTNEAEGLLAQQASAQGNSIVARGSFDASLIVKGDHKTFLQSLIEDQILLLNASAPGCDAVKAAPLTSGENP